MVLKGVKSQTSFIKEVTYGTKPTNVNEWWDRILENSLEIKPVYDKFNTQSVGSTLRKAKREIIQFMCEGAIKMHIQTGKIFQHILGKVVDAGVNPYTHTYDEDTTNLDLPSFSCQKVEDSSNVQDFTGLKVKSWSCKVGRGDKFELDVNLVGQDGVSGTQESVTENTLLPFQFSHLAITIDGGAETRLEEYEWSGENEGIEPVFIADNTNIPRSGKCTAEPLLIGITEKVTILRDKVNSDLRAKLLAGTTIAISAVFTRTASTDLLTITHSNCVIEENEAPTGTEGLHKEPIVLDPLNTVAVITNQTATG